MDTFRVVSFWVGGSKCEREIRTYITSTKMLEYTCYIAGLS